MPALLLFSPYGYSLVVLHVAVLLIGGLGPLALADGAFRWGFRRLRQPLRNQKRRARWELLGIALVTVAYFSWFAHWLLK